MKPSTLFAWPVICIVILASHPLAAQTADEANKAKLEQRDQLWDQAVQVANEGKLDEATTLFERVYTLEESIFGPAHPNLLRTLGVLAQVAVAKPDNQGVVDILKRQHQVTEKLYGKADYRTQDAERAIFDAKQNLTRSPEDLASLQKASALKTESVKLYQKGQYQMAVVIAKQEIEIYKAVLGEQHTDYANSLNNLAIFYRALGDTTHVEPLYIQAMEIQKSVLGGQHPLYATSLSNLAFYYSSKGDFTRAEPLYMQAMEIQVAAFGEQHRDYANTLNNIATLYRSLGDTARAEPLYTRAMEIQRAVLGVQHPLYATSLNNLAELYQSDGDSARAEPLFREALEIHRQVLGEQHPHFATSLSNLAFLYSSMGDTARAEPLYAQAMAIQKAALGEQHPDYATTLNNLAELLRSMGRSRRAETLFTQSLEIRKAAFGVQNPLYASSLNNLASLYQSTGDHAAAEPLYIQAMEIQKVAIGEEHRDYANSLNNLAFLYSSTGDTMRAEPLCKRAMQIREVVLGAKHPDYAASQNNLGRVYHAMGDTMRAKTLYHSAVDITLDSLESISDIQSQRQQLSQGESLRYNLDFYLSLSSREPKFQEAAYATLLRWKGSVWQRQRRQRSLIDQPELKPRFAELQEVDSRLSALILNPPDPEQRESWRRQLEELTDEREKLERDLSLASAAFREASTPVTPEQLRESLPEGTMLVDFLEYRHFTPANQEQQTKESYARHLLVHLVRAGQNVRAIDLGDVASLNTLVQTWRQDLETGQSRAGVDAARELRQRIWEPIEKHLTGITTVYVSPDGLLGQFPLAALPGKRPGSYLIEDLAIVMLPVPQGLRAMATTTVPSNESTNDRFCLVGGVDYEQVTAPDSPASPSTPATPSGPLMLAARGGQWQAFGALPGTAAEIDTIESLIRTHQGSTQTTILRGGLASEAAFTRNAPGNRYLHIATHGFFAPETVQNAMDVSTPSPERMLLSGSESRAPKLVGEHPDLLSGLVFAGANHEPQPGTEDGILTAAEVQSLDLRCVELAVLSACETGLGRTAGGEGIIGLQRAFQLAGAKTTITSLWQVDDVATQALMVEFYRNLFERKLSKLESLRQAQIWLLNNPDVIEGRDLTTRGSVRPINITTETKTTADKPTRSLPAYWAAFQLSGDPR